MTYFLDPRGTNIIGAEGLTAVFGMGTGVALPLWSPGKNMLCPAQCSVWRTDGGLEPRSPRSAPRGTEAFSINYGPCAGEKGFLLLGRRSASPTEMPRFSRVPAAARQKGGCEVSSGAIAQGLPVQGKRRLNRRASVVSATPNCRTNSQFVLAVRQISTGQLSAFEYTHLHPRPINLLVSEVPYSLEGERIANLGDGFPLRCFQRLSFRNIATQRCPERDNWHTIGSLFPILSY